MEGVKYRSSSNEKSEFDGEKDERAGEKLRGSIQVEIAGDKSAPLEFELDGQAVNASGHKDQLRRQYGIWSLCGLALTIDNAWVALGGSIAIAINNGGPPGVLYELLTACFYYGIIAASLAELASSIPSAGGVYHWASVTPGRSLGRVLGFFTGSLNFFGWIFDLASITMIVSNACVQMYVAFHPDRYLGSDGVTITIPAWQVYTAYLLITWGCCAVVIFGNRFIPFLQDLGLFIVIVGGIVTIIVVATMPAHHASNAIVWKNWVNSTGWSGGVAFLTGVLNGAYTIGTPDSVTHMAEELPKPRRDLPRAIAAQIILGTITSFLYAVAILYALSSADAVAAVQKNNLAFPLAEVYALATGNKGGTFGLLLIIVFSLVICVIGTFLTVGRIWWTLARDNATPFSGFFSYVNENLSCPIPATVFCAILSTGFGAISLGSNQAFVDLAGSFVILTTVSYVLAIAPNLFTGRRHVPRGPFWMGKAGFFINAAAVVLIIFFDIMFCFPSTFPTTVQTMNYNSVILVGIVALTAIWWLIHGFTSYPGPKLSALYP